MALEIQPKRFTLVTFRALRNQNFRLYLFGYVVSQIGTYMQMVAEGWLVYQLSNSAFTLGFVGFIALLPLVPFALVSGALADRMSRKMLLAIVQVGQIFPPLALAYLAWSGNVRVWHVVVVDLIMGIMATIDQPTRQALVFDVVGPEDLDNALALTSSGFNVARVVGPAIAGVMVGAIGVQGAFLINGFSFIAVLIALAIMRIPKRDMPAAQQSLRSNLIEGGRYLLSERVILVLIALLVIVSFFILPYQTLLPVFARDILHSGARGLGFLSASVGLGAIFGALLVTNTSSKTRGLLIIMLLLAVPIFTIGFAFSKGLILACFLLMLVGGFVVAFRTLGFMQIQLRVRDELRGRTTSIILLLMAATPRVGGLFAGFMANQIGAPQALGLLSVGCILSGLLLVLLFGSLLRKGN